MTDQQAGDQAQGTALVLPAGRAADVWGDAASVFVPALKTEMLPEERRDRVRDLMKAASHVDDRLNLASGELLFEVRENGYWKLWSHVDAEGKESPYKTYEEYLEDELSMRPRKAKYLTAIYETYVDKLHLPLEVLRRLEWTKARQLLPIINAENAAELIEQTKRMSYREVRDMVKAARGRTSGGTGAAEPIEERRYRLYPEQIDIVDQAIEIAKKLAESDKEGHALHLICVDFVGASTGIDAETKLEIVKAHVERAFGVRLLVVPDDSTDVDAETEEISPEDLDDEFDDELDVALGGEPDEDDQEGPADEDLDALEDSEGDEDDPEDEE